MEENRPIEKKPFKKKGKYLRDPRVVYVIGTPYPIEREPWKLKLQAIADCSRYQKNDNYKELVEKRYNELIYKESLPKKDK